MKKIFIFSLIIVAGATASFAQTTAPMQKNPALNTYKDSKKAEKMKAADKQQPTAPTNAPKSTAKPVKTK